MSVSEALDLDPCAVVLGTDLHDILKDQSHAPQGGDVGQRREDGQHPEVLEQGHAICSRELHAFYKTDYDKILDPTGVRMPNLKTIN